MTARSGFNLGSVRNALRVLWSTKKLTSPEGLYEELVPCFILGSATGLMLRRSHLSKSTRRAARATMQPFHFVSVSEETLRISGRFAAEMMHSTLDFSRSIIG